MYWKYSILYSTVLLARRRSALISDGSKPNNSQLRPPRRTEVEWFMKDFIEKKTSILISWSRNRLRHWIKFYLKQCFRLKPKVSPPTRDHYSKTWKRTLKQTSDKNNLNESKPRGIRDSFIFFPLQFVHIVIHFHSFLCYSF